MTSDCVSNPRIYSLNQTLYIMLLSHCIVLHFWRPPSNSHLQIAAHHICLVIFKIAPHSDDAFSFAPVYLYLAIYLSIVTPGYNLCDRLPTCVSYPVGFRWSNTTVFPDIWNDLSESWWHQWRVIWLHFPLMWRRFCCMRVSAGRCGLLVLAMFACISATVAAKGRWLLSHTPTHIFQGCPGIQITDPLFTQAVPAFLSVLIHKRDRTCPKALFPAKRTTPRIH